MASRVMTLRTGRLGEGPSTGTSEGTAEGSSSGRRDMWQAQSGGQDAGGFASLDPTMILDHG